MKQISEDMGADPPSKEDVTEVLNHLDTDVIFFFLFIFFL